MPEVRRKRRRRDGVWTVRRLNVWVATSVFGSALAAGLVLACLAWRGSSRAAEKEREPVAPAPAVRGQYAVPESTRGKLRSEELQAVRSLEEILRFDSDARARDWSAIVLHHSGTARGGAESFDAHHRRERGWRSLGYHFVIGNGTETPDGAIQAGPRWQRQEAGAHAASSEYNQRGIGVCLVGNFETGRPTEAQLEATVLLLRALVRRFGISKERILGHREVREGGSTACPGRFFPMEELRRVL
jgi:hypothetical protein